MRIVVVGAGGHGLVVVDILRAARDAGSEDQVVGVVDRDAMAADKTLMGVPVLGDDDALTHTPHDAVICAIGDNETRRSVYERLRRNGERFATAIHPSVILARGVTIGEGSVVCAGAIVGPDSEVEIGTILNTACTLDHHSRVGRYVHIAPGAHLGGECIVHDEALIGLGACILPGRTIGRGAVVGAGAVVLEHVSDDVTVAGNPARSIPVK